MTPEEIETAKQLYRCTFLPGSYEKRFVRSMASLSEYNPDAVAICHVRKIGPLKSIKMKQRPLDAAPEVVPPPMGNHGAVKTG